MTLHARLHLTILATLLLGGTMLGQQPSPPTAETGQKSAGAPVETGEKPATAAEPGEKSATQAAPAEVPPNAPVITINGLCPDKPAVSSGGSTPADCKTVITREEFEKVASAINPQMPPNLKRQLGDVYPRILLLSHEGQKLGLENDPRFKEMLHFASLQLLAQDTARKLNDEAGQISDQQLEQYYKENAPKFEQFTLQRIFIPNPEETEPAPQAAKTAKTGKAANAKPAPPNAEQVKALAAKIRARAAAGEDFDKLQKEAFDAVGLKSTAPTTKIDKMTRGTLPPDQESVFNLKDGEVSQVFDDPGGHYIYKVVSRSMPPLDAVKEQIKHTLQTERLEKSMKAVLESGKTELNEAYFGQAGNPTGMMPRPGPAPVNGKLPPNHLPH